MGSTLSCLAAGREQGATLSKKHPGRAEAIAEYKARRNAGKRSVVEQPVSPAPVPPPVAVEKEPEAVPVLSAKEDEAPVVETPVVEAPVVEAPVVAGDAKIEDAIEQVTEELDEKAVIAGETNSKLVSDDGEQKVTEREPIEEVGANTMNVDVEEVEVVDKATDQAEQIAEADDDTPVQEAAKEAEDHVGDTTEVTETGGGDKLHLNIDTTDVNGTLVEDAVASPMGTIELDVKRASEHELRTPTLSPLISARRAMFENTPDTIIEAERLERDVLDPVTGEKVTVEEYRRRQAERAQGVVKEHVEKYEDLDEQALKEMETRKLQEQARTQLREVRQWSTPLAGSSEPSSPIEPRKMVAEDLLP